MPEDDDLVQFLERHPVSILGSPEWIALAVEDDAAVDDGTVQTIRGLHEGGMSRTDIQKHVFGYKGGRAYRAVMAVLG